MNSLPDQEVELTDYQRHGMGTGEPSEQLLGHCTPPHPPKRGAEGCQAPTCEVRRHQVLLLVQVSYPGFGSLFYYHLMKGNEM